MIKIVEDRAAIAAAEQQFRRAFEARSAQLLPATLGYQSGSFDTEVMWIPSLGIWGHFGMPPNEKSPGERYWNAFGQGKPTGMMSITCEINPPVISINRRDSGAFGMGEDGTVHLLHRGRINVTGGITKEQFRQEYRGKWVTVDDGGRHTSMILITDLNASDAADRIRDFVLEVGRIKRLFRK